MKILFLILFLCVVVGSGLIGYGIGTMRALNIVGKEQRLVTSDDTHEVLRQITERL